MSNLDEEFARFEAILGRSLSGEERRLLTRWEAFVAGAQAGDGSHVDEFAEAAGPAEHEGRFKITWTKSEYEVGFVCPTIMLRAVRVSSDEDLLAFLTQEPICLDDMRIRQAIASARNLRPAQVAQSVKVSEPMLRSMGFEHL